jgi:hypothetical protein
MNNNLNLILNLVKSKLEKINKPSTKNTIIKNTTIKPEPIEPKIIKIEKKELNKPEPKKELNKINLHQMNSTIEDDDSFDSDYNSSNPNNLFKKLEALKALKKKEQDNLDMLKSKTEAEDEKLSKLSNDLGDKKRIALKNKEKEKENKNIFKADKQAYFRLKQDIYENKITENKISILFKDKYPIFKFMDMKNLLGTDDEYIQYCSIYDEMYPKKTFDIEAYVPHNVHYLNDLEKNKYEHIKNQNKDMIGEFLNKQIPPLEEVLASIDRDDNEQESNQFGSQSGNQIENQFGDVTFDL